MTPSNLEILAYEDTAHAALASSRVARVEAVELLPQVIDWLERGLVPRALRQVFDHVRVEPVTHFNALVDEERTDWLFFARRLQDQERVELGVAVHPDGEARMGLPTGVPDLNDPDSNAPRLLEPIQRSTASPGPRQHDASQQARGPRVNNVLVTDT